MKTNKLTGIWPVLACCILLAGPALAEDKRRAPDIRNPLGINSSSPEQAVKPGKRISNRKAASLVKQKYSSSRVLGVDLMDKGGLPIYRVRTLSPDGVVKSVYLDGETGEFLK